MAWIVIVKNNSGSTQILEELGITLLHGEQRTLTDNFNYDEIGGSQELKTKVSSSQLIINDGTNDLSNIDGVNYITLENLLNTDRTYYTISELQGEGTAQINWSNITNAPSFGSPTWIDPVKFRVKSISTNAPLSPVIGDVYIDSDDNHYYKFDGTSWNDIGQALTNHTVINLSSATQNIFKFNGTTWDDQLLTSDNVTVMVNDNGDGKNSQYIFSSEDNVWRKIADVDFASHFDGNNSKHDASEIDVEGIYENIPGSPTDLESIISTINNLLPSALDKSTLDEAYDEGGPGAGRIIVADSGAVKIDVANSTNAPLELVPKANLPSTGLADGQLAVKDGILCIYDATRAKWLSVQRNIVVFGRKGTTANQYLQFFTGNLVSNNSGFRLIRNACITSLSGQLDTVGTCNFNVRKNDSGINIATLNINNSLGNKNISLNIDTNEDDYLQSYIDNINSIEDPLFIVEFAWRL